MKRSLKAFFLFSLIVLAMTSVITLVRYKKWKMREVRVSTLSKLCDTKRFPKIGSHIPEEAFTALKQPYFFLGEGKQSMVFESSDHQFVLKFFKKSSKKKKPFKESIRSMLLAQDFVSFECALVASSSGATVQSLPEVLLLTKKGKTIKVNLATTPFLLQKKGNSLKETLLTLKAQKKDDEAKQLLESLFTLLSNLREKEIVDRDGALIRNGNIGIVNNHAVLIDTGKLFPNPDKQRQTLHDIHRLKPLRLFLEKSYPELVPSFLTYQKQYESLEKNN
jgi:hypothetical protein